MPHASHIPSFRRSPERRQPSHYQNLADANGVIDISVVMRIAANRARAEIARAKRIRDEGSPYRPPNPNHPIPSWQAALREELRSVWQWALTAQEVARGYPKYRAEVAAREAARRGAA